MRHVLVVDDEPNICDLLVGFLVGKGYRADAVHSGEAALAWLSENTSDMVLLDIRMPGISGIEVLERTQELYPKLPVIVITGHADEALARKALQMGAHDFFLKPFDLKIIESRISSKLELMSPDEKAGGD